MWARCVPQRAQGSVTHGPELLVPAPGAHVPPLGAEGADIRSCRRVPDGQTPPKTRRQPLPSRAGVSCSSEAAKRSSSMGEARPAFIFLLAASFKLPSRGRRAHTDLAQEPS